MKKLLPDSIATRATALLVVGLAVTHLVSNIFYATDRESALLSAGGNQVIQWVETAGALADTLPREDWPLIVDAAPASVIFATITDQPVIISPDAADWREATLRGELGNQMSAAQTARYRIAYGSSDMTSPALGYWRRFLAGRQADVPPEMIMISWPLSDGSWINAATSIKTPPRFFSKTLGLSMAVMLVAVVAISSVIVRRMTGPLTQLSHAAEKLGTDVRSPSIPESGPLEVRRTAHAFNVMQARIRNFVEDRTQMLAAIAHDLGTPITRLRLRAEFVEDAELRTKMHRDLDDMQHMVASTLAFIREDATSEPRETVDLGSLLARVCDDIQDTGVDVTLAEVPRWIVLECRPAALRRAIGNLVENAVKYGGLARVSLQQTQALILICIDDEGPGIPESFREDAFAPFRRLDAARNLETGGTGLGLSVARTIARAHGGDITLNNRADGGLRAELRLPRSAHATQAWEADDAAVAAQSAGSAPNTTDPGNSTWPGENRDFAGVLRLTGKGN